ncbi:CD209 antigen-like protein B [Eublepharis macularius]|uniref:CD209 antigen-like protein B n=1 Tax=Eublepharis macularius TaxID=481883 RepID=A0AA97KZR5_EUBMA|nr:CD209 antigen-like protein B [Eublepharis macularius]
MDDDFQNKVDHQSEGYENDILIQKLPYIPEVPPVPGAASDSEVMDKETQLLHKVASDLHSNEGKQISLEYNKANERMKNVYQESGHTTFLDMQISRLPKMGVNIKKALFAPKIDKQRDYSRAPIIMTYGLTLLSFTMATAAFGMALLRCFPSCPDGWKYFSEKCYNYSSKNNDWNNSRRLCQEVGADLVVINHEEEQDFLIYMMSSKETYWIGFSDLEEEGNWKWVDGTSNYTNWHSIEPNNGKDQGPEHCAVLQKEYNYMWNDLPCKNKNNYICEKNMQLVFVWQSLHISH